MINLLYGTLNHYTKEIFLSR